jgi:hypothetical protein
MGPAGAPVTRLTHPHDPHTHNHHLSLWIGHEKIGGTNFWGTNPSRIAFDHIKKIDDGDRGDAHDPGQMARCREETAAARRADLDVHARASTRSARTGSASTRSTSSSS